MKSIQEYIIEANSPSEKINKASEIFVKHISELIKINKQNEKKDTVEDATIELLKSINESLKGEEQKYFQSGLKSFVEIYI